MNHGMYQKKNFLVQRKLYGIIKETPLLWSKNLNEKLGFNLYLKAECLQRTGSFKLRGAYYCMQQEFVTGGKRDVVAFSSGNHAQGVALAAKLQNVKATIVMPTGTTDSKINNTKALGANVIFYDRYNESREEIAKDIK